MNIIKTKPVPAAASSLQLTTQYGVLTIKLNPTQLTVLHSAIKHATAPP
jgi:hypothetical protein